MGHTVATDEDDAGEDIEIMECNWPSFSVFLACGTQWRMLVLASGLLYTGLDYSACQVVFQHHNVSTDTFADLQVMEEAALEILNEAG